MTHDEKVLNLTAEEILAIPLGDPARLFRGSAEAIKTLFRRLRSKWYRRDGAGDSSLDEVFGHLQKHYTDAEKILASGGVLKPGVRVSRFETSTSFIDLEYYEKREVLNFADLYIGSTDFTFHVTENNLDLVELWLNNIAATQKAIEAIPKADGFFYGFSRMKATKIPLIGGSVLLRFSLPPGYLSLAGILERRKQVDPKQVAWMITRLHNYLCLLEKAGTAFLITPESIFIDPVKHDLVVMEGWQYAPNLNAKLVAAPAKAARLCPDMISKGFLRLPYVREMVMYSMRCALGDPIGFEMTRNKDISPKLASWVSNAPRYADPARDLELWNQRKTDIFGPAKFVSWDLTPEKHYNL